jgi:hypothetical protein
MTETIIWGLLGLVMFLVAAFIYFAQMLFRSLHGEIILANARLERILDRNMATDLTDYGNNLLRTQLLDTQPAPARIKPEESSPVSYSGGMYE